MTAWHSLYLPGATQAAVAASLRESALTLGYSPFDPFGLIPGRSYPHAVRLFIGPASAGWLRVVGQPDARQLPELSQLAPVLSLALDGGSAEIALWRDGTRQPAEAFAPWLRDGFSADDIRRILDASDEGPRRADSLPFDALPDDVRQMAGKVDPKQARSMFARLTQTTLGKAGGDDEAAKNAQALLAAGQPPDWTSGGGARISRLMGCLTVPNDWREPDFTTLRDAYQLHLRRQRRPNADLYPGDAEAMAAVPNALDYVPVYAGAMATP